MAIRKIGSRQIHVDGVAYRWRIRQRATYFQTDYGSGTLTVAIESHGQAGAVLILDSDRPHPQDCFPKSLAPVTPADISHWISQAINAGWKPFKPGPQFRMNIR